jgi:hypothetical protein
VVRARHERDNSTLKIEATFFFETFFFTFTKLYGINAEVQSPNNLLSDVNSILIRCLGAFAKFRKAIVSFVMSVRVSASNNSAPSRRIFMKCYIRDFFLSRVC